MMKVLIVENDAGVRESLAVGLSDAFLVEEAEGNERALSALEEGQPDVVLLDQNMDGGNGTSLLECLARRRERPAVVMFSASMNLDLVRRAFKLGAEDCISKPFQLSAMRDALTRAAQRRPNLSRGGAKPFSVRVAEMMQESAAAGGKDLDRRRRGFALQLLGEALADADGDLERAAARLMLKPEDFERHLRNLNREGERHE